MHEPLKVAEPLQGPPLTLEVGPRRARLVGDLDAFSGRLVEDELLHLALTRPSVVVDLSGVQCMTSGGLAVLERCRDRAVAEGHRFILATPRATLVQRVLDFAGVRHYVLQQRDDRRPPTQRRPGPSA